MITLTPSAQQHLQDNLANSPAGTVGVRIGLRDYGCSGYAYTIDYTNDIDHEDEVFIFDAIKVFIPRKFMPALRGTEIDFVTQGVNSLLQFNNPNVVNSCGCGESFKFKEDPAS